jgi:CBS domain-containing protein
MLVAEVMNKNVKTIKPDSTAQGAARLMIKYSIGSLIVTDGSKLAGIVTERDVLMKVVAAAKDSSKVAVKSIMSKDVVLAKPNIDIEEAARIMVRYKIKKLPIVAGNRLIGIVTATDIVGAQPEMMKRLSELLLVSQKKLVAG